MNLNNLYAKTTIKINQLLSLIAITLIAVVTSCNSPKQPAQPPQQQQSPKTTDTTAKKVTQPDTIQTELTLPVLDALFYDPDFASSLRTKVGLSPSQIGRLKVAAHASLRDLTEDGTADTASARSANQRYQSQIKTIIGDNKLQQLQQLVNEQYSKGVEGLAPTKPNFVPTDTRIVVNAPAFRMDVFQSGKLLKSYRVGIGYPEFPLPTGMRRADTVIFNPSWLPPDEPWVKGKFAAGRRVSANNKYNPLGLIKIPIGRPSLIHGGKDAEKIGGFASHGCVGLTNAQVQEFAATMVQLGGAQMPTDAETEKHHKRITLSVLLPTPVPIDLRYETIVATDSTLHIYRDVYERGTNTLENAKRVLASYGIDYQNLSDQEKSDLNVALDEMNRDPRGHTISTDSIPPSKHGVAASKLARAKKGKTTRNIKGQKEAEVTITALQGKGYPEPVDLNTGRATKRK